MPEAVQRLMVPPAALRPAMPPTRSLAETRPEKAQFSMVPRFSPAIPPTQLWLPSGSTSPSTRRSRTTAPAST